MSSYLKPKTQELGELKEYLDFLWTKVKPFQQPKGKLNEEITKVAKKIHGLSYCKRHNGIDGLDCYMCKLEGKF